MLIEILITQAQTITKRIQGKYGGQRATQELEKSRISIVALTKLSNSTL